MGPGRLPTEVRRYRAVDGATRIELVPPRAPGPADVVVEVAGSALGASPGAEVSGVVVATGEAAAHWLDRRVVVPRLLPSGECPRCRRGLVSRCASLQERGGVASHETVAAQFLLSVEPPLWPPDDGTDDRHRLARLAALPDAAATPYAALVRAQVAPGDACVVVGGNVRARFAIALLRARGAFAAAIDGDPARRELARAAGAQIVLEPEAGPEALREAIVAAAAAGGAPPAELKVIECTGVAAGRALCVELLAAGGTGVLLPSGDGGDGDLSAPLEALAATGATLLGSGLCHPDLLPELAALVVRGDLPIATQVELLPFSALAEAEAAVRAGRTHALPILCATSS
jgi:threonine dehydrogenase-like Zn-dependent dehydrogenase